MSNNAIVSKYNTQKANGVNEELMYPSIHLYGNQINYNKIHTHKMN